MRRTDPHTWILVLDMPEGPSCLLSVVRYALGTCLERVVRAESAGQQAQAELQMGDRRGAHRGNSIRTLIKAQKWLEVAEQGLLFRNVLGRTKSPACTMHEFVKVTREIMLHSRSASSEQQLARRG